MENMKYPDIQVGYADIENKAVPQKSPRIDRNDKDVEGDDYREYFSERMKKEIVVFA